MSLRTRLLLSVAFALLAGLILAAIVTIWQARVSVAREVGAALVVGRQAVEQAIAELPASNDPSSDLHRMTAAFDGDRHIRVSLIDDTGRSIESSTVAPPAASVPQWFVRIVDIPPSTLRMDLPPRSGPLRAVRLESDPRNEMLEAWNSLRDTAVVILALCVTAGALIWGSIGRALQPLRALSGALERVGSGEFAARLGDDSLPETRMIARAYNRMTEDLEAARKRNQVLHDQLLTMQEAERAEVARDLHDGIGPLLFALSIDGATVESAIGEGAAQSAIETTRSLRDTVQRAHAEVRAIVNRLRPVGLAEFGLSRALGDLVDFWRRRHPETEFAVDIPDGDAGFGELVDITAFRVVQEALSNALRHGRPSRIEITVRAGSEPTPELTLSVSDNGVAGEEIEPGFGLTGMRYRVEAAGGRLELTSKPGRGFAVTANLPLRQNQPSRVTVSAVEVI